MKKTLSITLMLAAINFSGNIQAVKPEWQDVEQAATVTTAIFKDIKSFKQTGEFNPTDFCEKDADLVAALNQYKKNIETMAKRSLSLKNLHGVYTNFTHTVRESYQLRKDGLTPEHQQSFDDVLKGLNKDLATLNKVQGSAWQLSTAARDFLVYLDENFIEDRKFSTEEQTDLSDTLERLFKNKIVDGVEFIAKGIDSEFSRDPYGRSLTNPFSRIFFHAFSKPRMLRKLNQAETTLQAINDVFFKTEGDKVSFAPSVELLAKAAQLADFSISEKIGDAFALDFCVEDLEQRLNSWIDPTTGQPIVFTGDESSFASTEHAIRYLDLSCLPQQFMPETAATATA